ncbi:MAG: RHS repeat-associated core domain-containing protein [Rudaea sp.]|uniref:RHS repeat domain-containing protein n=1 Tax=Rudaea sp. TaxID=2136325 RepID=UPI0039E4BB4F
MATGTGADWSGTITDSWSYDTQSHGYGQLATETHVGTGDQNLTRTFTYDGYGRLYQRQHVLSGSGTYTETTALDGYGRPKQQQDATGQITTTHYTTKGFADRQNDTRLTTAAQSQTIDAGIGGRLYELLQTNERGQPVSEKRGGSTHLQTSLGYYAKDGRLKSVCTNGTGTCALQDDQYAYDAVGNVTARLKNASSGKSPVEQLTYDGLNRLKQAQLGAWSGAIDSGNIINVIGTQAMTYDALGNLCTQVMTGTGVDNTTQTYTYPGPAGCANHGSSGSAARVTQITGTVNQTYQYDTDGNQTTRSDGRTLTYNALNQAVKAVLGGDTTTFQYGPEGDRYLRSDNGILTLYIGKVEITIANGTTSEQKRYLGVAIDLVMANDTRYVLTDHLGSTNVIAHADGTKVEQQAFDAWGNRRSPDTWTQTGIDWPITTTTHGFTGQEGVEAMGIVHFNGRIYDPQLGRMLQADPVQNPGSQGLNRYSYVANNPLSLTDPTGYSFWSWVRTIAAVAITVWTGGLALAATSFWSGMAIAAAGGFAAGVVATGTLQGGLYGAFSAAAFYGVGTWIRAAGLANAQTGSLAWGEAVGARAMTGGVVSSLEGGKFGNGFVSAGVTAAAGPLINNAGNGVGRAVIAAIIGGTASELSGGKFSNAAITSAFAQMFADAAQGEKGKWLYPTGKSTNMADYSEVQTNGIMAGPESDYQKIADLSGDPFYYNPSHGIVGDLLESFAQKFFGWAGDPLAQGFAEGVNSAGHPLNIIAHSQGVLTAVNAVEYYGVSAAGNTFDLRSSAYSYYTVESVIPGAGFNTPWFDIANIYSPSGNPLKWASGFGDLFCGACVHKANSNFNGAH